MSSRELIKKIAKRKMVERGVAQRQTAAILAKMPRCKHGDFPLTCVLCIAGKDIGEIPF